MRNQALQRNIQMGILIIASLGVAVALGNGVARWELSIREITIVLIGLVAVILVLIPRLAILKAGFYFWIATFVIGWRQLWITSSLRVHPAEVLIWFLFILVLAQQIFQQQHLVNWLSSAFSLFLIPCGLGIFVGLANHIPLDVMLAAELKSFVVVIPILGVSRELIRSRSDVRRTLIAIALTALFVSALGILEYIAPGIVAPFRGYFADQAIVMSQQGFARANFSFFGDPITSVFLVTILFINLSLAFGYGRSLAGTVWLMSFLICAVAVYLSGSRAPWAGAVIGMCVFVVFDLRRRGFVLVAALAVLPFMPQQFFNHLWAVFNPSQYYDTSVLIRRQRFQSALDSAWQNPIIGRGWGSSGWVHSDLVQIAANLGLPALGLFLFWYLRRLWLLWPILRDSRHQDLSFFAAGIAGGLVAALVCLGAEAVYVLPHLIIPIWFLLALAEAVVRISKQTAS